MEQKIDIAQCIEQNLKQYFKDLNGETPCAVYDMVLHQVEKPNWTRILKTVRNWIMTFFLKTVDN